MQKGMISEQKDKKGRGKDGIADYSLIEVAHKMPSRTDFLTFDIANLQAWLWTQSEQSHGSYRILMIKFTPAS